MTVLTKKILVTAMLAAVLAYAGFYLYEIILPKTFTSSQGGQMHAGVEKLNPTDFSLPQTAKEVAKLRTGTTATFELAPSKYAAVSFGPRPLEENRPMSLKIKHFFARGFNLIKSVFADSEGPNSPGTVAQTTIAGSASDWDTAFGSTLDGIKISGDGECAMASVSQSGDYTDRIEATNFGFSIPTGATIDGIVVEWEKYVSENFLFDNGIYIIKGGSVTGDNKSNIIDWPLGGNGVIFACDSSSTYTSYGSSSDLWGTTWTVDDINATNFGASLEAIFNDGGASIFPNIDHVRITIYYTTNLPPDTPTNSSPADGATGVAVNPTLTGSAYSDNESDAQTDADWQVDDDSDFSSPVWTRTAGSAETSTVVNSTNGTFANELSGQTKLANSVVYYWRVRYSDGAWSSWSTGTSFTTVSATAPAAPLTKPSATVIRTFEQVNYRWFNNENSTAVSRPLINLNRQPAAVNEKGVAFQNSPFRLRAVIKNTGDNLPAGGQNFKLQFSEKKGSACSVSPSDYQEAGFNTGIKFFDNNSAVEGQLTPNVALDPKDSGGKPALAQLYKESNPATNYSRIQKNEFGIWGFALVADPDLTKADTNYCFLLTKDGSALDSYNSVPEIFLRSPEGGASQLSAGGNQQTTVQVNNQLTQFPASPASSFNQKVVYLGQLQSKSLLSQNTEDSATFSNTITYDKNLVPAPSRNNLLLGSSDAPWQTVNAGLINANAINVAGAVKAQFLEVGQNSVNLGTNTISITDTDSGIVFGGGTNGTFTFYDAVDGNDVTGQNPLVKITDQGTTGDLWVSGGLNISATTTLGSINNARVGIGTANPQRQLHVFTGNDQSGFILVQAEHYSHLEVQADSNGNSGGPYRWQLAARADDGRFEFRAPSPDGLQENNRLVILRNGLTGWGFENPIDISKIAARITLVASSTPAGGILFSPDTNLYRSAMDNLKTDDSFSIGGVLTVTDTTNFNNIAYLWPSVAPTDNQILTAASDGTLSWADAFIGGGGSGWVDSGTVVKLETISDNVGIGISAPATKLHVVGDVTIAGNLMPGAHLTYDLGAPGMRWDEGYFSKIKIGTSSTTIEEKTISFTDLDPSIIFANGGALSFKNASSMPLFEIKDNGVDGEIVIRGQKITIGGIVYTWPTVAPLADQVLVADGSGGLKWRNVSELNSVPTTPVNILPADGATSIPVNPTLTASSYSDAENDIHIGSNWEVDDNPDFSSPVWSRLGNVGETSTVVNISNGGFANELAGKTELDPNITYYWRVRYSDAHWSAWSAPTSFTTAAGPTPVGLVGHWRFDENSGITALDSSGNGNNGTLINGPVWVSGRIGNALSFDGTNDYVAIAQSNILKPTQAITFAAWVNPGGGNDQEGVLAWDGSSIDAYAIIFKDSGNQAGRGPKVNLKNQIDALSAFKNIASPSGWYHVVGVYDSNDGVLRLYVNGVEEAFEADGFYPIQYPVFGAQALLIGTKGDTSESKLYWKGLIDDVRVYDRALSPSEIQALYLSS